jgi:cytoskeletal protein CcmA (bactofilin family)
MFTRDKEAKAKSDEQIRETITPLSDFSQVTGLQVGAEKTLTTAPRPGPVVPAAIPFPRDEKPEAKSDSKRLIVGRGISLDGKISSCDRLIVDGTVEAELEDCHTVEITENGTFKGAAEITGAEISGHYDGSLTVRESLLIRGTGRVNGTVRYGRLHIEDGGEISGDVKSLAAKG